MDILHAQRTLLSSSTKNDEIVEELNKTFDKHEDEHPQVRAQLIERWLQELPVGHPGSGAPRLVRRALPEIVEHRHRGPVFDEALPAKWYPRVREQMEVEFLQYEFTRDKEFNHPRMRELQPTWLVMRTWSMSKGTSRLYATCGFFFFSCFDDVVFFYERE